jgi:hypothetical protein
MPIRSRLCSVCGYVAQIRPEIEDSLVDNGCGQSQCAPAAFESVKAFIAAQRHKLAELLRSKQSETALMPEIRSTSISDEDGQIKNDLQIMPRAESPAPSVVPISGRAKSDERARPKLEPRPLSCDAEMKPRYKQAFEAANTKDKLTELQSWFENYGKNGLIKSQFENPEDISKSA